MVNGAQTITTAARYFFKLEYDIECCQDPGEKAKLEEYVQYPGSDCRNGGLIRVADGYDMMERICSHHVIVLTGKRSNQIKALAEIFDLRTDIG